MSALLFCFCFFLRVEATPAARMELRSGAPTELAASIAERWSAARHRPTFRKPIGLVSSLVSRVRAKNKKRPSASLASPASSSSEDASDEEDGSDSAVNDPQVSLSLSLSFSLCLDQWAIGYQLGTLLIRKENDVESIILYKSVGIRNFFY